MYVVNLGKWAWPKSCENEQTVRAHLEKKCAAPSSAFRFLSRRSSSAYQHRVLHMCAAPLSVDSCAVAQPDLYPSGASFPSVVVDVTVGSPPSPLFLEDYLLFLLLLISIPVQCTPLPNPRYKLICCPICSGSSLSYGSLVSCEGSSWRHGDGGNMMLILTIHD